MRYQGGKARLAGKLAPYLRAALAEVGGHLVEPFVGGFNIVPAVADSVRSALCTDAHPGLIALYRALQDGWNPPEELGADEYRALRVARNWEDPKTAFAAFGCSYGGKEWGGYARTISSRIGYHETRNYAAEARAGLLEKRRVMDRCVFLCVDYQAHRAGITGRVLFYCDPPYSGTTGYGGRPFDHAAFYEWCERQAATGNIVLVSEFTAPDHWDVLWEARRSVTLRRIGYAQATERLFRVVSRTR